MGGVCFSKGSVAYRPRNRYAAYYDVSSVEFRTIESTIGSLARATSIKRGKLKTGFDKPIAEGMCANAHSRRLSQTRTGEYC